MSGQSFHPEKPLREPGPHKWRRDGMDWVANEGKCTLYIQHVDSPKGFTPHFVYETGFGFGNRVIGTDKEAWEEAKEQGMSSLHRYNQPR